jgi:type II secretion system protein H
MAARALKTMSPIGQRRNSRPRASAFTLIELIIVMTMLVVILAVTFPTLQRFFRGRAIESEARRFLTLTRYAQNRAVAEAVPMVLWVDANDGSYGLEAQSGFLEKDDKAVSYDVNERIHMELELSRTNRAALRPEQQLRRSVRAAALPEIIFAPDGSIDAMSVAAVRFVDTDNNELWVSQTQTHLAYEVTNEGPNARR